MNIESFLSASPMERCILQAMDEDNPGSYDPTADAHQILTYASGIIPGDYTDHNLKAFTVNIADSINQLLLNPNRPIEYMHHWIIGGKRISELSKETESLHTRIKELERQIRNMNRPEPTENNP